MSNPTFQVAVSAYVRQEPCPLMAPLVGRFFGKKGEKLDKCGANLSFAALPGKGHRVLHNNLQSIVASIMKLCGILAVTEASNFLLGKVGEPYIGDCINHLY